MPASHTGTDAEEPTGRPDDLPMPTNDEGAPTTTHAAHGAGNPRLVFTVGQHWDGVSPTEFPLAGETTTIGSGADVDLRLEGALPLAATIRHVEGDEYVLERSDVSSDGPADPAQQATDVTLRSGAPVVVEPWSMVFQRDEFADHGRPFGGREGGEGSHQPQQPRRPSDTTDPFTA